jgi:hypothetical protein
MDATSRARAPRTRRRAVMRASASR